MKITNARQVIDIARQRGFSVHLRPGPPETPVLHISSTGKATRTDATDPLIGALRAWRVEIIDLLKQDEADRLKQATDNFEDDWQK